MQKLKQNPSLKLEEVLFAQQQHARSHYCACVAEHCEICAQLEQLVESFGLQPA